MALLLRKACEPILSDFDLDAFHADLDEQHRMVLFTPCGKHWAFVHGVNFSRKHPTQTEIDYATDLLIDWCERNKANFAKYLQAKEHLDKLAECPESEFEAYGYAIDITSNSQKQYVPMEGWVSKPLGITFSKGNTVWYYYYGTENSGPVLGGIYATATATDPKDFVPAITGKEKVAANAMKAAIQRLEDRNVWQKAAKTVDEIESGLNTCHN